MTREEVIEYLKSLVKVRRKYGDMQTMKDEIECLEMAIKALEQESRDCKTCKHSNNGNCAYTEECHECMWENKYEQEPILDKIRAEILQMPTISLNANDIYKADVLAIIDKYKTESEEV